MKQRKLSDASFAVARLAFTENGTAYIFDYFDVFFSITEQAKNIQLQNIFRAMDLMYKSIDALGKELAVFLQQPNRTQNERNSMLNALKMLVFAEISMVKKVDKEVIVMEGKKQKKSSPEDMDNAKWEDLRYAALLQMFNILQLPLGNLWDPPVAEESFVNLCADFAYRTIEHPTIKKKEVEDMAFQLLGTLLKSYNHTLVFPTRIFELMKSSESAAAAIAGGVIVLYQQYGIQTILKVIIDQILNGLDNNAADGPVVKNISCFFTELGAHEPTLVMPFIRDIANDVLSLDSYQLRICILQLMAEIVQSELSGEELNQDEKDTRDEYLEHIYSHILDVNAHVRSKALSLCSQMKHANAIPLTWISSFVRSASGRLEDKSTLVRKNSIILIKSFLEHNPFAAKLSLEELVARYEEKRKELTGIRDKMAAEAEKMDEVNEKWEVIIVEMRPFITECLALESIEDERIRRDDLDNLLAEFPKMLEGKEYER